MPNRSAASALGPLFSAGTIWGVLAMQRRLVRHVLRVYSCLHACGIACGLFRDSLLNPKWIGVLRSFVTGRRTGIDGFHNFHSLMAEDSELNGQAQLSPNSARGAPAPRRECA